MNQHPWQLAESTDRVGNLHLDGRLVRPGDRVRLNPRPHGDVFDLALAERTARVESVQQDFEGHFHVVVVVDDDPGRTLGPRGPAHRFFFSPDELERVPDTGAPETTLPTSAIQTDPFSGRAVQAGSVVGASEVPSDRPLDILVAGIGNIFLGDDGFGVEVAQRLARRPLPPGVRVTDFGIRGYDLAYALMAGPDWTILVDACPRGDAPGTVYLIDADLDEPPDTHPVFDAHDMNPLHVLRLAQSLGASPRHVLVVGCEPATLGPEEGQMGLSPAIDAAVDEAVALIESLIVKLQSGGAIPHSSANAAPNTGGRP